MRFNNRFRRSFGAMAAIGGMATLSACGGGTSKPAVDGKVTDITVITAKNPWSDGIKSHLAEYKKLTGVTVKLETYGNEQLNDQYKVKLNASASDFDVMAFQVQDVMREFSRNGWLTDMTKYVGDASEWNWNDFQKSARDSVTLDNVIYGVPLMTERHVMYYRSDLLKAAGIAVPKTLDELKAAAAKLHNPARKMTGIAMRGQRVPAVTQFSSFLYSFGGDFQKNDTATIDTPEAIAAYNFYGNLLRESGPPGSTNMGWIEASALFAQGKAAFYLDADSQAYTFLDPKSSAVVDTVAYAPFPAGPAGAHPYSIVPWTAGINKFSEKKDAAWAFIKWATSDKQFVSLMANDTVPSPRNSSWANKTATDGFPAGLVANVKATATTAVGHDRPQLEQVARSREIVGGPIVAAIQGGDVKAAIKEAQLRFQDLLKQDSAK